MSENPIDPGACPDPTTADPTGTDPNESGDTAPVDTVTDGGLDDDTDLEAVAGEVSVVPLDITVDPAEVDEDGEPVGEQDAPTAPPGVHEVDDDLIPDAVAAGAEIDDDEDLGVAQPLPEDFEGHHVEGSS